MTSSGQGEETKSLPVEPGDRPSLRLFVLYTNKCVCGIRQAESSSLLPMAAAAAKSLQLFLTLCDPIDGSPPDSPIPGILQARTLEWVPISFSNA